MKLFIKKSTDIQIANQIEVDLGNGFESYETENLITNGLELSDDSDFSKIKVRHNNKILENIEIMKKLEIKNVPVDLSESTIFPNCCYVGDYVIPEGVTSIGSFAFQNCTSLTSIEIPEGVTSIQWAAFSGCTGLTSVVIPDSVTSIKSSTFSGCTSLKTINYTGTEEQWDSISKGSNWNYKVPSDCQFVFNYVG